MGLLKLHDHRPRMAAVAEPPEAGPLLAVLATGFPSPQPPAVPGRRIAANLLRTLRHLALSHCTPTSESCPGTRGPGSNVVAPWPPPWSAGCRPTTRW